MGFRTGAYAKVWEVTPMSDTSTKVRMSVSRKNKQTGEYEQDFFRVCTLHRYRRSPESYAIT